MKVQMSINDDLLQKIDAYADANYMTRSGFVSMACAQYLAAQEVQLAIKEMAACMRRIADSNKIEPEQLQQLEDIERVLKFMPFSGDK